MLHPSRPLPDVPDPSGWLHWWTLDPAVIGVLLLASSLYTIGAVRMWQHAGTGHGVRPWQAIAHGAGLVTIAVALLSPLDRASDVLFSAHMAQHELLMIVAAPLIVLGHPLATVTWALPRRRRVQLSRSSLRARARPIWRIVGSAWTALLVHALTRWLWHLPSAFDAALADERLHAVQHLMFFATATWFWWALLHGRYGRAGYGLGVLFVFLTMLHSGLLAALLGLGDHPLYAAHASRTAAWGVDAIADQQRAGLVMWIPAGIAMMGTGLAMLAAWLGQAARTAHGSSHPSLRGK
jgi:putative membrane protein